MKLNEDEVVALYQKLNSTIKVAHHFGVCDETIRRILIRHGIQRRKPRDNRQNTMLVSNCHTKRCYALVVFCVKCGYDAIPVSNITGYPHGSVSRIFKLKTGMTVSEYLHDGKGNRNHPKKLAKDTLEDLYINKKMTQCEIASMFGMSQTYVRDLIQEYGIQPEDGHTSFRHRGSDGDGSRGINKGVMRQIEAGKRRCIERLHKHTDGRYEYVSGYKNRSSKIIIRCTRCGAERHVIANNVVKYPLYCSNCDSEYRSMHNHGDRHIYRAIRRGVKYEHGITIESVIKRFNNICQICGKPCD